MLTNLPESAIHHYHGAYRNLGYSPKEEINVHITPPSKSARAPAASFDKDVEHFFVRNAFWSEHRRSDVRQSQC